MNASFRDLKYVNEATNLNVDILMESKMTRERSFDVNAAVNLLNKILDTELATIVYYTHYAFMIYGHARIPIRAWFNEQATESLNHAREAGDLIVHLGIDRR